MPDFGKGRWGGPGRPRAKYKGNHFFSGAQAGHAGLGSGLTGAGTRSEATILVKPETSTWSEATILLENLGKSQDFPSISPVGKSWGKRGNLSGKKEGTEWGKEGKEGKKREKMEKMEIEWENPGIFMPV